METRYDGDRLLNYFALGIIFFVVVVLFYDIIAIRGAGEPVHAILKSREQSLLVTLMTMRINVPLQARFLISGGVHSMISQLKRARWVEGGMMADNDQPMRDSGQHIPALAAYHDQLRG